MTMKNEKENSVFDELVLERVPIYLQHLTKINENQTDEFYAGFGFSESTRHQSACYINTPLYKPVSTVLMEDFINELKIK